MQRIILLLFVGLLALGCSASKKASEESDGFPERTRTLEEYSEEDIARAKKLFIEGVTAFEMQDFNLALDKLTMAYIAVPDDPGVNFALADAYMYIQDFGNALYYAKEAVDIDPTNKWYHVKVVEIYIRDGQTENALTALRTAHRYFPSDIDILALKAGTLAELRRFRESNEIYDRMQRVSGPDVQLFFQKYRNYMMMDDIDGAIGQIEQAIELDNDNARLIQILGGLYTENQQTEKALALYESALEAIPNQAEIKIGLADLYIQIGDWDSASAFIREMVEDPMVLSEVKKELMQFMLAQFMQDPENDSLRENTASVIESFTTAYPDDANGQALAADFYLITENDEMALLKLRETVRLMPENEPAWRQLVQIYFSEGKNEELIEIADEAERWVPEDAFIRFFIGMAYAGNDQHSEAIDWLTRATEVPARPNFKSIIFGVLGDTYEGAGRWPDAVEAYEEAIALDPDNSTALNNYAYFLSVRNERLDDAYEMSLRSVAMEPNNASYLDTLGWIYFKKGNYEKAYEYIAASIENGGTSATILEHMGDVYDKLGDSENAIKWWSKAFDADPDRDYLIERIGAES